MNFVSLDFETANPSRVSICAAGMAVFEGGVTETSYWLVRPPKGHGWFHQVFIECHGLTHLDVVNAPEFSVIAPEMLARLTRADLVIAHNAAFDIEHLRAILDHFGLRRPEFDYVCTCQLARRVWPELPSHGLKALTAHIGHVFNHHHAQSDAEAAGRVLLAMMKQVNANTPRELLQKVGMEPKHFCRQYQKCIPLQHCNNKAFSISF
jgi:DNA polymerase III subunit epsilon